MDEQRGHDSLHDPERADNDGDLSKFDYIAGLMNRARKGRVIERNRVVKFEQPETLDAELWRAKALHDLREWMLAAQDRAKMIDLWAAVYIRCGACLRGWQEWVAENPIGDDLPAWIDAATKVVTEKRWI